MDINKCRICLESHNLLLNIFNASDKIMISTKIMSLANIKIYPKDGLPAVICTTCNRKLDSCIDFIKTCEKSDYDLRKFNVIKEGNSLMNVNPESDVNESVLQISPKFKNQISEIESGNNREYRSLYQQKKVSKKQQCFTCGKIVSSRFRLKTHLATHLDEKPHSCPYCKKKFTIIENLNTHLRIHTGEKPYRCALCGESFAQSSGLLVHKRKHTGQKPYQCLLCPRSFQTIGNLRYHIRAHTGERKYECDACSRAFITRSDLKQHIMTHSGEKPHVCCVCGMRFSRASNLKRHIRYLHSEEKSFVCEQCPSKFVRKTDLAKHSKKHKNKLKVT